MTLSFTQQAETFGFNTKNPWALEAVRLLFNAPRVYEPLADGWDEQYPGTRAALERMAKLGFVAYQDAIVVDPKSKDTSQVFNRAVDRFRTTSAGIRLLSACEDNPLHLRKEFPRLTDENAPGVLALLKECHAASNYPVVGCSAQFFIDAGLLPRRSVYFWIGKLCDRGLLRKLPMRSSDDVLAVPAHWRRTRMLSGQLANIFDAYPNWGHLRRELRLSRRHVLDDIEIARVAQGGTTDYSHDVTTQALIAQFLTPNGIITTAPLEVEPHRLLKFDRSSSPWRFARDGDGAAGYQPDALFSIMGSTGPILTALEYEHRQVRRAVWTHIERLLGYVALRRFAGEHIRLLFVVDAPRRAANYAGMCSAFASYAEEHPELMPGNEVELWVTSRAALAKLDHPFDPNGWNISTIAAGEPGRPVLHPAGESPFDTLIGGTD